MIASEVYQASLATSGKLKLRAKARLADGGPQEVFDACVLLHETARLERRAVQALLVCPPQTRLLASIEECWSLVEGRDPPAAARAWGRILRERGLVDATTAGAMLERLAPRYAEQQRAFSAAMTGSPAIERLRDARSMVTTSTAERTAARRELSSLLGEFPGSPGLWWMAYRLAEADDDKPSAWDALTRARALDPENRRLEAMSLLVGAWALSSKDADAVLAGARARLESAGPDICLMYALAEIQLARAPRASARAARWQRAHQAAQAGLAQEPSRSLRRHLRAAELVTTALLAGDEPTMDILYLAGLDALAVQASPKADVVELLTTSVRRDMPDAA